MEILAGVEGCDFKQGGQWDYITKGTCDQRSFWILREGMVVMFPYLEKNYSG